MAAPTDDAVTLPGTAGDLRLARGQAIGRYLVLEEVGAGAMGVVYAAYDPQLDRKVALKLVRTRRADADLEERLLREARALARLSHPNVVAVHDAGTHEGQVFLAMEHVPGITLARWLEQAHPWEEIVAVFVEAGRGLAAAHHAKLVHRDFKPDNVLVDTSGRARVTDFGLARAVDTKGEESGGATTPGLTLTRAGSLTGTPAYMSPEQFGGRPADERSDQFSFCVALYEALWGHRPFRGESVAEIETAVVQGRLELPPPSKVPTRVRDAVLRGLARDPAARHPTLDALLDELSRRPAATAVRALVVTVVVGALASAAFAWRQQAQARCTGSEAKLTGVWDTVRRRAAEEAFRATKAPGADTAARLAFDRLDAWAGAWATMHTDACRATRVTGEQSEDMLDRRMRCLSRKLVEVDAQAALFEKATPDIVQRAAQAAAGLPGLAACADLDALRFELEPLDPALAPRVAEQRRALAEVKALRNTGRYAKALERAEQSSAAVVDLHVASLEAEALFRLGDAQELAGQATAAEATLERAVFAAEACGHQEVVAEASVKLVLVAGARRGRHEAAGLWERHALAAIARLGGGRPDLEGDLHDHAASALMARGLATEALARHRQALPVRERAWGPDHPLVAASLNNTANVLTSLGRLEEAEAAYRRALDIYQRALGPEHPRVAMAHDNLAGLFEARGDIDQLAESAQRGLALRERVLPPRHPELALSLIHVAVAQSARGQHEAAIAGTTRALDMLSGPGGPGPSHPLTLEASAYAADALEAAARHAQALEQYDALLATLAAAGTPALRLRCEVGAAQALVGLGRPADAMKRLEAALRADAAEPPSTARARGQLLLAELTWQRGDHPRGHALVEAARQDCVAAGSHAAVLSAIEAARERLSP